MSNKKGENPATFEPAELANVFKQVGIRRQPIREFQRIDQSRQGSRKEAESTPTRQLPLSGSQLLA